MSDDDPRVTPARPDLAAKHLEGKVQAARYVEGEMRQVAASHAPIRQEPRPDALMFTEVLKGELVKAYDTTEEGWSWGQSQADNYVGWLPTEALGDVGPRATHKVAAARTLVFPGPSIKLPPTEALPLGARIAMAHTAESFAVTASGGHVPMRHLAPVTAGEPDFVAVAERFVGAPYLWGGKTSLGLDCSGLVQVALTACGIACPRDSDMQERALGTPAKLAGLRRGDLVFWKGHVAIARDDGSLVHANAHHMAVAIEPVADAVARIRAAGSDITSVKRMA